MYTFLLILLILDSVVLAAAVLAQSGKGGGLAASFGGAGSTEAFLGLRQAGNLLTKASWWAGGIFLVLAFVLALMSGRSRTPRSILEQQFNQPAPTAPAPGTGAPVVPLEPAPTPSPQP